MNKIILKTAVFSISAAAIVGQINQTLNQAKNFHFATHAETIFSAEESRLVPVVKQGYPISDEDDIPGLQIFLGSYICYAYELVTVFFITSARATAEALAHKILLSFNLSILPEDRSSGGFKMSLQQDPIELSELLKIGGSSKIVYTVMSVTAL